MPKVNDIKAQREMQIVGAAKKVFAKSGYQNATMDNVATEAKLAKGTLYHYFKSKEDLFYAIFSYSSVSNMDLVFESSAFTALNSCQKIEFLLNGAFAELEADQNLIPLTLEYWSACGVEATRERFSAQFSAMLVKFREIIIKILKDGQEIGEIKRDIPISEIASTLLALVDGLIVQQWVDNKVNAQKIIVAALPYYLASLKP